MGGRPGAGAGFGLAAQVRYLIGRQTEIEAVTRLVDRCRLVTLTGPSGIGKTRIAIEVARRIHDGRHSRAVLVELAPHIGPWVRRLDGRLGTRPRGQ